MPYAWETFCPGNLFSLGSWGVQYADRGKFVCCQPPLEPNVKEVPKQWMPDWTCGTPTDPEAGDGKLAYNFPSNTSHAHPEDLLQRSAEHFWEKI